MNQPIGSRSVESSGRAPGELVDRLTIDLIKAMVRRDERDAYMDEIRSVEGELRRIVGSSNMQLDSYLFSLVISLAQINLHIWLAKDLMSSEPNQFDECMKLGHQLNGLRNQLKNLINQEFSGVTESFNKSNTGTDGLGGWQMSVFAGRCVGAGDSGEVGDSCLADLLDSFSITHLKEVLLPAEKAKLAAAEYLSQAGQIDHILSERKLALSSAPLALVALIAQGNLLIWKNKDRMLEEPESYMERLAYAQDANGVRNLAKNRLMRMFGEYSTARRRASFIREEELAWYAPLLDWVAQSDGRPVYQVSLDEMISLFGMDGELPSECRDIAASRDFRFHRLDNEEQEEVWLSALKRIDSGEMWVSGPDQRDVWEKGWSENLDEYAAQGDVAALKPKFLQSKKLLRWHGRHIEPLSPDFEFDLVDVFRRWLFARAFSGVEAIYEFGCGSGQHLPVLKELYPETSLHGLDWAEASIRLIQKLNEDQEWSINAHQFNLFEPDYGLDLGDKDGVLTVGTLEQLGTNFNPFLQLLLQKQPKVVVHVESLEELYDPDLLSDYLAIKYDRARNYLSGYLTRLRELESEGEIKIERAYKVNFGSRFHDSYSYLIWRPLGS